MRRHSLHHLKGRERLSCSQTHVFLTSCSLNACQLFCVSAKPHMGLYVCLRFSRVILTLEALLLRAGQLEASILSGEVPTLS